MGFQPHGGDVRFHYVIILYYDVVTIQLSRWLMWPHHSFFPRGILLQLTVKKCKITLIKTIYAVAINNIQQIDIPFLFFNDYIIISHSHAVILNLYRQNITQHRRWRSRRERDEHSLPPRRFPSGYLDSRLSPLTHTRTGGVAATKPLLSHQHSVVETLVASTSSSRVWHHTQHHQGGCCLEYCSGGRGCGHILVTCTHSSLFFYTTISSLYNLQLTLHSTGRTESESRTEQPIVRGRRWVYSGWYQ